MSLYMKGSLLEYLNELEQVNWKADIEKRLKELEEHTYRTKRSENTTIPQQLLILKDLNILPIFQKLGLNRRQQAKLLSVILNGNEDYVRKAYEGIYHKDSPHKTPQNYKFLYETYKTLKLEELTKVAEKEIIALRKKEEKEKEKK